MLSRLLLGTTVACYGVVAAVFVTYVIRRGELLLRAGRFLLGATLLVHVAAIGSMCVRGLHPLLDAAGALNLTALILGVVYLAGSARWRLGAAGALVVPLAFSMVLSSYLTPRATPGWEQPAARVFGDLHLTLVAMGVAAFALAAAVAVLYLLQENALRANRLGVLYRRTPPLTTLDAVGRRLIGVGFPIYTMAVLTGILWMYRLPSEGFRIEYLLAGVIWAIFCALIVMRVTVGVSGRRAAVLTLVGFAVTALVLFVYVGRRLAAG